MKGAILVALVLTLFTYMVVSEIKSVETSQPTEYFATLTLPKDDFTAGPPPPCPLAEPEESEAAVFTPIGQLLPAYPLLPPTKSILPAYLHEFPIRTSQPEDKVIRVNPPYIIWISRSDSEMIYKRNRLPRKLSEISPSFNELNQKLVANQSIKVIAEPGVTIETLYAVYQLMGDGKNAQVDFLMEDPHIGGKHIKITFSDSDYSTETPTFFPPIGDYPPDTPSRELRNLYPYTPIGPFFPTEKK